jgi:methionyl-tRNA formyltransferase
MVGCMAVRLGVVTGTLLGAEFIAGLREGLRTEERPAELSLLMALHPSQYPGTVGYADVCHAHGNAFKRASYVVSAKTDEFQEVVTSADLDFLLVVSFSQIVPARLLNELTAFDTEHEKIIYRKACIGAHPSPLPVGRGRAPIPWTILKALKRSALTTFVLSDGADNGPIISQHPFLISNDDDVSSIYKRVMSLHREAGRALAKPLSLREIVAAPQDEASATSWGKRTPSDAHIHSGLRVDDVCALVRASQWPYPPAFVVIGDSALIIAKSLRVGAASGGVPGQIVSVTEESLHMHVADGVVELCFAERQSGENLAARQCRLP